MRQFAWGEEGEVEGGSFLAWLELHSYVDGLTVSLVDVLVVCTAWHLLLQILQVGIFCFFVIVC